MAPPGTRVGSYEIVAAIGAGGMGEVYRAYDTKLSRDVALKILPEAFALNPDRLARFQREARVLASLNHPNIAHVYGLEQADGVQALVMELVDGETLAEKLGPPNSRALNIGEALTIARQIAEALEGAHEQGIIHRDLKPANIKVTPDGRVKVLDFGLAKALNEEASGADMSHSPTLTAVATRAGVIVGTAAYMSPEQARGKTVDKRADIWAFGCVLYEMLTGRRAFAGDDVSDTLVSVLTKDPDWSLIPASTPPSIRTLLRRSLEKDPKRRLADIASGRLEIDDALATPVGSAVAMTDASSNTVAVRAGWRRALPWAVAVGAVLAFAATLVVQRMPGAATGAQPVSRLTVEVGADATLAIGAGAQLALSPDGQTLVFDAQKGGQSFQLFVRRLDQTQATLLSGTEGARGPFFSPDGQWVGFFADGKLKKISVTGGAAVTICDAPNDRGGSWAEDGTITFAPNVTGTLSRVSSAGGKPEPLTTLADGEEVQQWPQVLAGGKAVLYTGHRANGDFDNANIVVQSLPRGEQKILQRGGYYGRYLASGHLTFMHAGTLFAAPFDLDRLELSGEPFPVIQGISGNVAAAAPNVAVSHSGTLVYRPGEETGGGVPIDWMDSSGKTTPMRATAANWSNPAFAPDGRRLAVDILEAAQSDVWVYEWERDTLTKLTFDTAFDIKPVWTPDGRRIVFTSLRGGGIGNLYWQRADGTGEVQRLTESKNLQLAGSWHPNGRVLAFQETSPQTSNDIMTLPIDGDEAAGWKPGKPTVFLNSPFQEGEPMFSPDGRWIAYQSNESGRAEVYVRPFPGPGGKWQISTNGGAYPMWSASRRELLYQVNGTGSIMATSYSVEGQSFRADKPHLWTEQRFLFRPRQRSINLHPDGQRLALAAASGVKAANVDKVVFIFNFFDELRRLAPAKR